MARPKSYDRETALIAARDLFWERGYEATSITDLEERTGLSRSSLYEEFGSKRDLFQAALECYADEVIANLLADLARPDASLETVAAFFIRLGRLFNEPSRPSTSGCLLVNATAELASRDERLRPAAAAYRDSVRASFRHALRRAAKAGDIDPATVETRAQLLSASVMGIWLTVRIDAADAARLCTQIAREVASWTTTDG
jgi:TetR/AcrR family transcriptional repressor of nem operon